MTFTAVASGPGPTTEPTLNDVLDMRPPGRQAVESLRHILSTPNPATRWRGLPSFGRELFRLALLEPAFVFGRTFFFGCTRSGRSLRPVERFHSSYVLSLIFPSTRR